MKSTEAECTRCHRFLATKAIFDFEEERITLCLCVACILRSMAECGDDARRVLWALATGLSDYGEQHRGEVLALTPQELAQLAEAVDGVATIDIYEMSRDRGMT